MKIVTNLALSCFFAATAHNVFAADLLYVRPAQVNALLLLAAPPHPSSLATARELAELHRIEEDRSRVQIVHAMADDRNESIFLFADIFGPGFVAQNLPLTAKLSMHVADAETANTDPLKAAFARMRPYNLDATLRPVCKTKAKDDSYPSGHTTVGYLLALTLIEIVPARRDAILARADDYANNRLVCGVHYRSDIQAGKSLAYAIHALMTSDASYQADLSRARDEIEHFLGGRDQLPWHLLRC